MSSPTTNICATIAGGGTFPGFMPVPTHVYLGTCSDTSTEPTWEEISNVESITIAAPSTALLDVTNLNNPSKVMQQIPGLTTLGDVTLTVNLWPDDPTHDATTGLIHLSQTKEIRPYRVVCQYDTTDDSKQFVVTFSGFVTGLPLNFQATGVMKMPVTIRQFTAPVVTIGMDIMPLSKESGATLKTSGGQTIGMPVQNRAIPSVPPQGQAFTQPQA